MASENLQAWIDQALTPSFLKVLGEMSEIPNIAPPRGKILASMEYFKPLETKVVIIGQDPYPTDGQACGLSFSIPDGWPTIPASLKAIIGCLKNSNLLSAEVERGDLTAWAQRGALLLNTALTTVVGSRRAHATHWKTPVQEMVDALCRLCRSNDHTLVFMLWGGDAFKTFSKIAHKHGHVVMHRPHPSPLADNKLPAADRFVYSRQFIDTLEHIDWRAPPLGSDGKATVRIAPCKPKLANPPIVAFCDGGCSGNGKPHARAAYGVCFMATDISISETSGEVIPRAYELAGNVPISKESAAEWRPSNNRGELLAMCVCLSTLIAERVTARHIMMVSDSNIYVNMLSTGFAKRIKQKTTDQVKNLDLITIGYSLLAELRKSNSVEIVHTRGHQSEPSKDAPAKEKLFFKGNKRVDELCNIILYGDKDAKCVKKKRG